jgi:septum formation protein
MSHIIISRNPRLILASASQRRLDLLKQIGVKPDAVRSANIDETPLKGELPRLHALRLARKKARTIAPLLELGALTLAADTVVACGRRILPKTETESDARACLNLLSGRGHRVYTAVALIDANGDLRERINETRVIFKRLSAVEINQYIALGEWRGKAGGYAIQGYAAAFVRLLTGSYSSVVGLPLFETISLLIAVGFPF